MYLEETPEQLALRAELRAYFAELLTDDVRRALDTESEGGATFRTLRPPDGHGRLAGHRLADRVRRPGQAGHRPVHLLHRGPAGPGPVPLRDPEHRRPDDHAPRHRRPEEVLPLRHPGRRDQLRHRLHRARGGHRPRLVADPGGARRGRVGDQRQQGLHQRRRPGRLHLAGDADRPRRPEAQGDLHLPGADIGARVLLHADRDGRRRGHHRVLLRRRPGAPHRAGGGAQRGMAPHHRPAQPRAGRPGGGRRAGLPAVGRGGGLGRRPGPRGGGLDPGGPGPDLRPARGPEAPQLADDQRGRRRHPRPRRLLRGQGLRHRVHRRDLPPAARHRRRRRLPAARASPGRSSTASSSVPAARPRSTPSAAASTRSSARSWPRPGSG